MKRQWREPTDEDKKRKCRARSKFEKKPFYVVWNGEYDTWARARSPHILISVDEILEPAEAQLRN